MQLGRIAPRDRETMSVSRHCGERLVRRSSTSEGGSDEAIHSSVLQRQLWIASRSLSSGGAFCANPLARNNLKSRCESAIPRRDAPEFCMNRFAQRNEGAGNAGCPMHPQPRVRI